MHTKRRKTENSMPAGGELAALFARRMEGDLLPPPAAAILPTPKSELAAALERRAAGVSIPAPSAAPRQAVGNASGRLLPKSSPPPTPDRPPLATPPKTPVEHKPPESTPPVRVASTAENEELKAIFEERNLEVGIPTPAFLVNVRANLKKPGSATARSVGDRSGIAPTASSDAKRDEKSSSLIAFPKHDEKSSLLPEFPKHDEESSSAPPAFPLVKRNSFPTAQVGGNQTSHQIHNSTTHSSSSAIDSTVEEKASSPASVEAAGDASNYSETNSIVLNQANNSSHTAQVRNSHHKHHRSSSDFDLPIDEKAASEAASDAGKDSIARARANSDTQQTLNARRRRLVASRTPAVSVASSTSDLNNNNINKSAAGNPKASSAKFRKDKILAKVRASHPAYAGDNKNTKNTSKPGEINNGDHESIDLLIVSPKRDEFEVLFADHDFGGTSLHVASSNNSMESRDSITKEMRQFYGGGLNRANSTPWSAAGSAATMPMNNTQPRAKITTTGNSSNSATENDMIARINATSNSSNSSTGTDKICDTPEKSRRHNASTPKIRGNGSYRRESYDDTGAGGESTPKKLQGLPKKRLPQHLSSMPSFQEQQHMETEDYLSTPQTVVPPYPFRQSPSQLSQMSGITTPSCFPQESSLFAPSSTPSFLHLHQPILGGPIPESYSANSSVVDPGSNMGSGIIGGYGAGLSDFSPGMEAENQHLRELIGLMTQKLEEKDAIISQLMKRIGDLETMNGSAARGAALANTHSVDQSPRGGHHSTSSVSSGLLSAKSRSTGFAADPYSMNSLWDHSVRRELTVGINQSATATATLDKSTSSVHSESACLAGPSSYHHSPQQPPDNILQSSPEQQAYQRQRSSAGKKTSPSTITNTTSSTASVTTANSSKSGTPTRSNKSSRSLDAGRRSAHRRNRSTSKMSDERKFVC